VVAAGKTGKDNDAVVEYHCRWGSNPEATANVLTACARALARFYSEGRRGAMTMLDAPPSYFSTNGVEELLKHWM
ncbi:MAG: diaminopimelate dehydrogenase, partial [Victivallaceae bacterium]|nr:diaminopimelate dehydrogenase [Victivallaceae bacterium]